MQFPFCVVSPLVPSNAVLERVSLECGWVTVQGHTFFADRLVFLFDRQQRTIDVDVAYDADDPARAWIFDPERHVWLAAENLYPRKTTQANAGNRRQPRLSISRGAPKAQIA